MSEQRTAGRELDALVADVVFQYPRAETFTVAYPRHYTGNVNWPGLHQETPRYSADIAAAWRVVERLAATHTVQVQNVFLADGTTEWACWAIREPVVVDIDGDVGRITHEESPSAPLAICLAALKAIEAADDAAGAGSEVTT